MDYRKIKLEDLKHEIELNNGSFNYNLNNIHNHEVLFSKYIEKLDMKYISNSNIDEYIISTSDLSSQLKIKCLNNEIILLTRKVDKAIIFCTTNLNLCFNSFYGFNFDEVAIISKNLYKKITNSVLIKSNKTYKFRHFSKFKFYKKPINNSKPFELFIDKIKDRTNNGIIFYLSDYISYIYINKKIEEVTINGKNFYNDIIKALSIIKYLIKNTNSLIIINNMFDYDFTKDDLENLFFCKTSMISKESFQKIYNTI